jgi:flagellar hook assembly protein FlgD
MRTVLEDLFGIPSWGTGSGGEAGALPGETHIWALGQNSPNPFVSSTAIRYDVARAGRVSIRVYNAMGQLVKVLEDGRMEPGTYSVSWDGTNRLGRPVAAGVYFYAMEAGGFSATRKALVLSR